MASRLENVKYAYRIVSIGDDWYDRGDTAVLWVPSVVSPYESNALCNQLHADFSRIVVGEPTRARVDARLPSRT